MPICAVSFSLTISHLKYMGTNNIRFYCNDIARIALLLYHNLKSFLLYIAWICLHLWKLLMLKKFFFWIFLHKGLFLSALRIVNIYYLTQKCFICSILFHFRQFLKGRKSKIVKLNLIWHNPMNYLADNKFH